jgi:5-carboxymethyl-2-hydroxymuconate isomerase
MPHFIIEHSANVFENNQDKFSLMNAILIAANDTEIFAPDTIKVRLKSYDYSMRFEGDNEFIHLIGYIMEGRSEITRTDLSRKLGKVLINFLPDLDVVSVDIREIKKSTYSNRKLLIH